MLLVSTIFTALAAIEHVYFFVLEAILWQKPMGLKTFKMDAAQAAATASLAKNQGTYNLFLSAGLLWGILAEPPFAFQIRAFFLGCVIVAAIVGAVTANVRILFVQGIPAVIAAVTLAMAHAG